MPRHRGIKRRTSPGICAPNRSQRAQRSPVSLIRFIISGVSCLVPHTTTVDPCIQPELEANTLDNLRPILTLLPMGGASQDDYYRRGVAGRHTSDEQDEPNLETGAPGPVFGLHGSTNDNTSEVTRRRLGESLTQIAVSPPSEDPFAAAAPMAAQEAIAEANTLQMDDSPTGIEGLRHPRKTVEPMVETSLFPTSKERLHELSSESEDEVSFGVVVESFGEGKDGLEFNTDTAATSPHRTLYTRTSACSDHELAYPDPRRCCRRGSMFHTIRERVWCWERRRSARLFGGQGQRHRGHPRWHLCCWRTRCPQGTPKSLTLTIMARP